MSNFFRRLRQILGPAPEPAGIMSTPVPVVSERGIDLIKHFESCLKPVKKNGKVMHYAAYADPAHGWRVPTIGWGTIAYEDGTKVAKGDIITQERADELLAWEVAEKAAGVSRLVKVSLNADQFGALVSFAYNVGLGNLGKSTLLRKLNEGDYDRASIEFLKWNRAAGMILPGLVRRRKSERALFLGKTPFIEQS